MINLRQSFGSSLIQLCVLFVLLVIAREVVHLPGSRGLPAISLALPLLWFVAQRDSIDGSRSPFSSASLLLAIAFALALALRMGMTARSDVLLGYDPGMYKYLMDTYIGALPDIAEADLPEWLRQTYPQGLPTLGVVLHLVPGLSPEELMRYLFPLLMASVVFPVYLLAREVFGSRAAVISALLYAVSYTQLSMFSLTYLKNGVALFLLPLALLALHRRSYPLFGLLLGGIAIYHRPTLMVLVICLAFYILTTRQRGMIGGFLVALVVALPMFLFRIDVNWELIRGVLDVSAANLGQQETTGGGTFFDLETYRWVSLAYQPFAIVGAIHLVRRRLWTLPLLLLLVCAGMVLLQIAFFRRHIIPLDLAMVLLAGVGIERVFLSGQGRALLRGGVVAALVVGAAMPTLEQYRETAPLLTRGQMDAVQWLASETPANAAVVVTSYDAPWALGWSGRRVIAPGLFQWNLHDNADWQAFLVAGDPQEVIQFLEPYGSPLYVYHSDQQVNYMAYDKFQEPLFRLAYEGEGARIFEYLEYSLKSSTSLER
ncbi:MAG: glycosyltransferase family 39 protein [Chloroflexota bacterium]